ncbi:MAG TPA: phosphotransferase [Fibrobacteraceae bacterium]|nr:phosphotransferase [Fibrobacteraceae bacterium]
MTYQSTLPPTFLELPADSEMPPVVLSPALCDFLRGEAPLADFVNAELAGTAGSGRRYYRLFHAGRPWILQQSHEVDADFGRFVEYCRLFHQAGLPVPELFAVDEGARQVLMEDLGKIRLWDACALASNGARPPNALPCEIPYFQTMQALAQWQATTDSVFPASADLRSRHFDEAALRWETAYYTEHYLLGHRGMSSAVVDRWSPAFDELARRVAKHPQALMHRDFQSQNIMLLERGVGFVDFQGARAGSRFYDLASLLWDPYVEISLQTVQRWFGFWLDCAPDLRGDDAWRMFLEASLQRLMQAMGAYGNLSRNKGLVAFAAHIPAGERKLRLVIQEYTRLPDSLPLGEVCP